MKRIGVILESTPYIGGGFQYSRSLFEAVYSYSNLKNTTMVAFYIQEEWSSFLENYDVKLVHLTNEFSRNILLMDGEDCEFIVGTVQKCWSYKLKTPVIEPIHDLMHRYEPSFPEVSENDQGYIRDIDLNTLYRNAIGILVDSEVGARHVKEQFGLMRDENVFILPYAAPALLKFDSIKVALSFDKYFFYPAQFWNHKNHAVILKALSILKKRGLTANFVFVGSKKNGYESIIKGIKELDLDSQVQILGYVSDSNIRYLYEHARALVMPTFFGPTNIPPIEAVSIGCPVAVSRIYEMPNQLGDAAVYFDPGDPEELAEVLKKLWVDDYFCGILIENGKRISYKFTQEYFNNRFAEIGDAILKIIHTRNSIYEGILSFCKEHENVFIYGAGEIAYKLCKILERNHIRIKGLIVTSLYYNQGAEEVFNRDIREIDDIDIGEKDGIILSVSENKQNDIMNILRRKEIEDCDIFRVRDKWVIHAMRCGRF